MLETPARESLLRTVPTNTEVFCAVYDYAGKADLSKDYGNKKKKIGGNHALFIDNKKLFSAYTRAIFDCVVRKPTIF